MLSPTSIPPELVYELALGLAPPVEIMQNHGFTADDYRQLMAMPAFQRELERVRVELNEDGWVRETKLKLMADQLLDRTYQDGMSPTTHPSLRLDITKNFAKWSGLEKASIGQVAASGMTIQINLPNQPTIQMVHNNLTSVDATAPLDAVSVSELKGVDIPGFSLDLALLGSPLPEDAE
jgi:hypothetical protein